MAVTRQFLSGGTGGAMQIISNTASPGNLVHTCPADVKDEVYLYCFNFHSADLLVTVEWAAQAVLKDRIPQTVPFNDGLYLLIPGLTLLAAQTVHVFCATGNLVAVGGFVNRDDT